MNRSFEAIARRALLRSSLCPIRDAVAWSEHLRAARRRDARTMMGPHSGSSRAADRRYAIHTRRKVNATLALARGLALALTPRRAA